MHDRDCSDPVILKNHRVLRAIFNDAVYSDLLDRSPVFKIELPPKPKRRRIPVTPEDVWQLTQAIAPRYSAAVWVAATLGLRWAEMVGLQVDDLDLDEGRAVVRRTVSEVEGHLHLVDNKNHLVEVLPIPNFVSRILDEHIARYAGRDVEVNVYVRGKPARISTAPFVFTTEEGCLIRRNIYVDHYKPAVIRAGLNPALDFHDLRKATGSTLHASSLR